MKLHNDINQNIPEEIQSARITQAARLRAEKNSERRTEGILIAMEKLENIRRGRSNLALARESNKNYQPVRVSATLAKKLMGEN